MRLSLTIALTVLLLAAPAAADAGVRWVVVGHGFGHGVGMSQYGAYGFAKRGRGYRAILRHYYRGTGLARLPRRRAVRVLIDISPGGAEFGGATAACGRRLDPRRTYRALRAGRSIVLAGPAGRRLARCGRRLRASGGGRVRIAGKPYRGAFEAVVTASEAGSVNAINAVPVDQYVKGVIAEESPPSWPMAALRAQAVAARSFALSSGIDGNGFGLYSDTRSQVYGGIAAETARTNRAAESTRGEVVTYRGEVAQTLFSACSGGYTESVQNVFFGPAIPYLVGVPDPYDGACPLHRWTLRFSGAEISARLGSHLKGRLRRIVVTRRGVSPRIVRARLYGTGGVSSIRGDSLAYALGAHDRWMSFRKIVDGRVVSVTGGGRPRGDGGGRGTGGAGTGSGGAAAG